MRVALHWTCCKFCTLFALQQIPLPWQIGRRRIGSLCASCSRRGMPPRRPCRQRKRTLQSPCWRETNNFAISNNKKRGYSKNHVFDTLVEGLEACNLPVKIARIENFGFVAERASGMESEAILSFFKFRKKCDFFLTSVLPRSVTWEGSGLADW